MTDYSYLLYKAYIMERCYECSWVREEWIYRHFMQRMVAGILNDPLDNEERSWWSEILSNIH